MDNDNYVDNDVSLVYANDTVDFGTTTNNSLSGAAAAGAVHDGGDQSESNVDDDGDDDQNKNIRHLPQHINDNNNNNNNNNIPYQQHSNYLNTTAAADMIDNRQLVYIPIRLACGVCAYCSPDVLRHCPMVLRSIQADLTRAFRILPVSVHTLLRRTNIWLNWNGYAYGPKANPRILRHVTTHHHPAWLTELACDTPQKALSIEIYSCVDFQYMRLHWNGSGLLIHELCHLIHQCCLEDGLENRTVEALYGQADASGRYEKVLRRDWAGKTTKTNNDIYFDNINSNSNGEEEKRGDEQSSPADFDLAYAMVDQKEFFAEISVAFLCNGYHALNKADPNVMEACNPPLLHPDVSERVRVLATQREREHATANTNNDYTHHFYHSIEREYSYIESDDDNNDDSKIGRVVHDKNSLPLCCWAPLPLMNQLVRKIGLILQRQPATKSNNNDPDNNHSQLLLRMVDPVFQEEAMSRNCANVHHCNKFYPFTRGQLRHHDPDLFSDIRNLWREVSMWEDPLASMRTKKRLRCRSCFRWCPSLSYQC